MSTPFNPDILTRRTEADLSSSAWMLVIAVGDDETDLAGATSTATGDLCIGALTNDVAAGTAAAPVYVPVQVGGIIKVSCGGVCASGALAMADLNGEAITATTGKFAFGIALGTYADGEIGSFLWAPSYYKT